MIPCRCRRFACQARRSIAKPPEKYTREPKCKRCGGGLRIDKYRRKIERSKNVCQCHGYAFPHAHGRGWCVYNAGTPPRGTWHQRGYTEADAP